MFALDHVAIEASDIAALVRFYKDSFGACVLYQDESWAFLQLGQGKLALVKPGQHPPHVALRVELADLEAAAKKAATAIKTHRDGTRGIYVSDPQGNKIELICYPPKNAAS